MKTVSPVLVIHGGTGAQPERARIALLRRHLRAIAQDSYAHLRTHSALETVQQAVRKLEDDALFNAGTGSMLQRDGKARMSASIMDGSRLRFAAALNIQQVRHPIDVAAALLEESDRVLAGEEATRFARTCDMPRWNPITEIRRRQWRLRIRGLYGTVGAVALDRHGRLAAATSTGGKGFERPGRVSDSGMPAGNYANARVAVSCTGIGEDIIEEVLAARLSQRIQDGATLRSAFLRTFSELREHHRHAGAVAVSSRGQITWQTTLPILYAIAWTPRGRLESF